MIQLELDGRQVTVESGASLLDAAQRLAIPIPTLCHIEGRKHFTSCMVCVVEDKKTGGLLPACSYPAQAGMVIATASESVLESRKAALELLLGDHVGDCEGPCRKVCPAYMDIPLMLLEIAAGRLDDALATVKRHIALPGVLGWICPAPCEKGCRRRQVDDGIAICTLHGFLAEAALANDPDPATADSAKPGPGRVAIVGTGPAGLAAAYYLLQAGQACTLFDDHPDPGGMLRYGVAEQALPRRVLDGEIAIIRLMGAEFQMNTTIGKDLTLDDLRRDHDAVILASGKPATLSALGVKPAGGASFATNLAGVFAGGGAIRAGKLAVRSVAHGRSMALAADRHLRSLDPTDSEERERFNSSVGKLHEDERAELAGSPGYRRDALSDADGKPDLVTSEQAKAEALRCLHCECLVADGCRFRDYCNDYGADGRRFKGRERPGITKDRQSKAQDGQTLIFEPGKCIKCGCCVRISEYAGEPLGLTFHGRGFAVQVGVPLGGTLDSALVKSGKECVDSCPTGALAFEPSPFSDGISAKSQGPARRG